MLSFSSNAWFDEECKAHLKLFKLTKVTKQKGLNVVPILKNGVEKEEAPLSTTRKEGHKCSNFLSHACINKHNTT